MTNPEVISASQPVRQFSVFLHNRVGSLMSVVRLLKDHHIEVIGVCTHDSVDLTLARLVVTDPEGTSALFMERGIAHADCPVVVVELQDGDRDLAHCLSTLMAAEINIRFSYPLLQSEGNRARMAINVDDHEVGASALHLAGFRVLHQNDLSR